jgi:hypothetical protein
VIETGARAPEIVRSNEHRELPAWDLTPGASGRDELIHSVRRLAAQIRSFDQFMERRRAGCIRPRLGRMRAERCPAGRAARKAGRRRYAMQIGMALAL